MPKKILLADDEKDIREFYLKLLTDEGYSVDAVSNGEEALAKILEGGYDLIILDVIMPKIDGIGILTELTEQKPKQKNGPIILFTNLVDDPAIKQALEKGVNTYFIKTDFTPDVFLKKIKEVMGK
jgi:CheY-like chemotaxis protein